MAESDIVASCDDRPAPATTGKSRDQCHAIRLALTSRSDHSTAGGGGLSGDCGDGIGGSRSGGIVGGTSGGVPGGGRGGFSGRGGVGRVGIMVVGTVPLKSPFQRQRCAARPVPTVKLVRRLMPRAFSCVNTWAGRAFSSRRYTECAAKSQHGIGGDADDMRLRYHLVSLYALKPIPDDLLSLAHEIGTRLRNQQADGS
jgi:hypothetical protein